MVKFDGGPTVITAPWLFDEIWTLAGRKREDYFKLVQCDPFYRIFNHEGEAFNYNGDHEFILKEIDRWNPADKAGYEKFMATTKEIFETGMALIDKPFLKITDMLKCPDLIWLQSCKSVRLCCAICKKRFSAPLFLISPTSDWWQSFRRGFTLRAHPYLEREYFRRLWRHRSIVNGFGRAGQLGVKVHLNSEAQEI
jgi:phytoene desaturase